MDNFDPETENKKDNMFIGCCAIFICCLTIIIFIITIIIIVVPTFFSIYYTRFNNNDSSSSDENYNALHLGKSSNLCKPVNYSVNDVDNIKCIFVGKNDANILIMSNTKTYYNNYLSLPHTIHIKLGEKDKMLFINAKSNDNCKIMVTCRKN